MKKMVIALVGLAAVFALLLMISIMIIKQNQSKSGFDIYIINTVNKAYLVEIEITNDKQMVLYNSIIPVGINEPADIHPNFEFADPLMVQVRLKSIPDQIVIAKLLGNWPGNAGISEEARIVVGLVIKKQNGVESIEFQSSVVLDFQKDNFGRHLPYFRSSSKLARTSTRHQKIRSYFNDHCSIVQGMPCIPPHTTLSS